MLDTRCETGVRSPEELETLLEDAFVLCDPGAVSALFEPDALIADAFASAHAGTSDVARVATANGCELLA